MKEEDFIRLHFPSTGNCEKITYDVVKMALPTQHQHKLAMPPMHSKKVQAIRLQATKKRTQCSRTRISAELRSFVLHLHVTVQLPMPLGLCHWA